MDNLRKLPFIFALVAIALVVAIEVGSTLFTPPPADPDLLAADIFSERLKTRRPTDDLELLREDARKQAVAVVEAQRREPARPGLGISTLALIDGIVLFTMLMMAVSWVVPERIWGRLHGAVRLVVMVLLILAAVLQITIAFVLLTVMFGLFVAAPFGTIAYLTIWGSFDRSGAKETLAILLGLKLVFCALLVFAQQRFLAHKGLVALVLTSLVANALVAFLHGLVPRVMVSITDALAAVVLGVIAVGWAAVMAIGAVISVLKSIRVEKESS